MSLNLYSQDKLHTFYRISQISLATSSVADLYTTHRSLGVDGVYEKNFLARTSDGKYNPYIGIPLKVGFNSGIIYLQEREARVNRKSKKIFTIVNFAIAGFYSYLSVRNYQVVNRAKNRSVVQNEFN